MKKPKIESLRYENIKRYSSYFYIRILCLDFSLGPSYNNTIIETPSHNMRHEEMVNAIDRDTNPTKSDYFR